MKKSKYFFGLLLILGLMGACQDKKITKEALKEDKVKKPNIVYILADDLGYGDVRVNYPSSKINTASIDRLASQGMRFIDAHSPSAVCTPTRYSLLTGRYSWRGKLREGVLKGYGRSLIEKDRPTVASLLQKNDYKTAIIGKWHLGLDWVWKKEFQDSIRSEKVLLNDQGLLIDMPGDWIDFEKKPSGGPNQLGFDYSYILPASLDMAPYCYLENGELENTPNAYTPGNDLNTGYYGAFWRAGRVAPDFKFEEVLPTFTSKAVDFIHKESKKEQPFFLYFPLAAPHTPWLPTEAYKNKSKVGQYGDFVHMVDETVGLVLSAIEESGVSDNTIVIFTSDNGPFWGLDKIEEFNHRSAGSFRGMKADIYEGGHRVPFIVRWPGKVKEGSVSDAVIDHTNLMATVGDILEISVDGAIGEDSRSILPILLGKDYEDKPIINHSAKGFFALRTKKWKLIDRRGSGGFSSPVFLESKETETSGQLYNLEKDPNEIENLYSKNPEKVKELNLLLEEYKSQ